MNLPSTVLIIDDDATLRRATQFMLEKAGYAVRVAVDGAEGLAAIQNSVPDAILVDLRMPKVGGLEVVEQSAVLAPDTAIIVMTAHGTIQTAVDCLQRGAFDFITKPFGQDELLASITKALRQHRLLVENRSLRKLVGLRYSVEGMVAVSEAMRALLAVVAQIAPTPSSVMIMGETGTGKELLAKAIHSHSLVASGPFFALNIAGVPEQLFESELFGHKRGSFTGAHADRAGALETAAGGTLFLDEIGHLALPMQVKLLRVLQEREYRRLGEDRSRPVNLRFICATNLDLEAEVAAGRFREDLYYRICVVPIEVPALRTRREDIPALAVHFLKVSAERLGRPVPQLSPEALDALCEHDFPGNVRECENLMERAVALSTGELIGAEVLRLRRRKVDLAAHIFNESPAGLNFAELEAALIREALERSDGNQSQAARLLSLSRNTLLYRMEKFGLKKGS